MGVFYSPARLGRKIFITGMYIAFLSISAFAAVLYILTNPCGASRGSECLLDAIFIGSHMIFVNPIVTLLAIAALPVQLRELKLHGHAALSLTGLASQAVIFAVLALSWAFRVPLDYNLSDFFQTSGSFISWYQLVGWAAINNLVYGYTRGLVLSCVKREEDSIGGREELTLIETLGNILVVLQSMLGYLLWYDGVVFDFIAERKAARVKVKP